MRNVLVGYLAPFSALMLVVTLEKPAHAQAAAPAAADDIADHDRVDHHFAVGYFGISQLPIGNGALGAGAGAGLTQGTVNAPVIGIRYWLNNRFGLDLGVGFGYGTSSTSANGVSTSGGDQFGLALHGGVPIAFAHAKHFTFELVPEATVGFTSGTGPGGGAAQVSENGVRIDAGARIGAEIQFGFIGIPQLSLEGSVGAYLQYQGYAISAGGASESSTNLQFSTSVGSAPWAIFTDTISALYYF